MPFPEGKGRFSEGSKWPARRLGDGDETLTLQFWMYISAVWIFKTPLQLTFRQHGRYIAEVS